MINLDGKVVKDLIENHGFKLEDFLEKAPSPLNTRYLVIPGIMFTISTFVLCFFSEVISSNSLKLAYVSSFGFGTWVCASMQIRFKNIVATFCVAIGIIIITLLAIGLISPTDTIGIVKGLK